MTLSRFARLSRKRSSHGISQTKVQKRSKSKKGETNAGESSFLLPPNATGTMLTTKGPIAIPRPHEVWYGAKPGELRGTSPEKLIDPPIKMQDSLFWLRDDKRTDPVVLAHLAAENSYTETKTAHLRTLREKIYKEHIQHLKETDREALYEIGSQGMYFYYKRTVKGKSYPIYCRIAQKKTPVYALRSETATVKSSKQNFDGPLPHEEILLDVNFVAHQSKEAPHCTVSTLKPEPTKHQLLAYTLDRKGDEVFSIHFRSTATSKLNLKEVIENVSGDDLEWSPCGRFVFYVTKDEVKRPWKVWVHLLGTSTSRDQCIFTERDELYDVGIRKSICGNFLLLGCFSSETTEEQILSFSDLETDQTKPNKLRSSKIDTTLKLSCQIRNNLVCVQSRTFGIRYEVFPHPDGTVLVLSNHNTQINNVLAWTTMKKIREKPIKSLKPDFFNEMEIIVPHRDDRTLTDVTLFRNFAIVSGREHGLTALWVLSLASFKSIPSQRKSQKKRKHAISTPVDPHPFSLHPISMSSTAYSLHVSCQNQNFETDTVRVEYSTPITPPILYDINCATPSQRTTIHTTVVPHYDPSHYVCERHTVPSIGGVNVDLTLIRKVDFSSSSHSNEDKPQDTNNNNKPKKNSNQNKNKGLKNKTKDHPNENKSHSPYENNDHQNKANKNNDHPKADSPNPHDPRNPHDPPHTPPPPQPTLLYGYGSYGVPFDPGFSLAPLPYLSRGVPHATAHTRGGGENGRAWHRTHGAYLTKANTFHDFIACAEYLVVQRLTPPGALAIEGRSAGGLLLGTVLNWRPELFRVALAGVPFVDVMTTMGDGRIPLTVGEWQEWGNPNEGVFHAYMRGYAPMENIREQAYPHVLALGGLHDSRVGYWEPTKWVSRLREANTERGSDILLKMDMDVGHFSASDRYRYWEELAFEQAFVLDKLGKGSG